MLSRRPMYSARTLLVAVLLMGGLIEVTSAQHKYIFPQFAFGGGWESTLIAWTDTDVSPTTCAFSAQGRFLTMRDEQNNVHTGTEITVPGYYNILKTETPDPVASSGMAVLDCDKKLLATYTLFSLSINGSLVGEAVVEAAEEVMASERGSDSFSQARFPADHRNGARFGMALANPSNQPLTVRVSATDIVDPIIHIYTTVGVPANTAKAFFIDELEENVAGRIVGVDIWPEDDTGPSVYAVGLRINGPVFTTIPAIIEAPPELPAEAMPPSTLWAHSGTGNTVFDMPSHVTRVRIKGTWNGNGGSNFFVYIAGRSVVITTLRSLPNRTYEGTHLISGGGVVEITGSGAGNVSWTFTEVR